MNWCLLAALIVALPLPAVAGGVVPFDPDWPEVGAFTAANRCDQCHSASDPGETPARMRAPDPGDPTTPDSNGVDLSPLAGTRTNIMGHSMNDPYFHAVTEDETDHFPALSGAIEDGCLKCHAPMGHAYAHEFGLGLDGDGFYRVDQAMTDDHARAGIGCTLCHQIEIDPLAELANGAYQIRPGFELIGPYMNPAVPIMAGYVPLFDPLIQEAELCGTCHNLFTDTVDVDTGMTTGGRFLEQATWYEWRNSDLGGPTGDPTRVDCQQCHMPRPSPSYTTTIAVQASAPLRTPFGAHSLPGGNTHMLDILAQFRTDLGLDPALTSGDFDPIIEETRSFLSTAAGLDLQASTLPGAIQFTATINNQTGHKLPSGFPSRRMWIHLRITDRSGTAVFESGQVDANGRLALDTFFLQADCLALQKPPGFDDSVCFEPHRDLITDPSQVALFESVMADTNGQITHVLKHADGYRKDNRIPPAGFMESGPDFVAQTATIGVVGDADFNVAGSGADTVTYQIDTSGLIGPFQVDAELLYQSIRPSFVDGLQNTGTRVTEFKTQYAAIPPPAEVIAAGSASTFGDEVVFLDSYEN